MNTSASFLLLLLIAPACMAFAPASTGRDSVALSGSFDGKMFDIAKNPLARGGKNSWEFELDTMYVEEPKATPANKVVKKVVKKVTPKAKVAAKSASPWSFGAKKASTKKVVAKSSAYSAFGKSAAAAAKKAPEPKSLFGFLKK